MQYDATGNLTWDGYTAISYDGNGQQASSGSTSSNVQHGYDGGGLRVKKVENGVTTYYVRSSVLAGHVIGEINAGGVWQRGYVYMNGQMLAIQDGNGVSFVHQDPVTKSQRLTDVNGNVVSTIELDPFGGETARSENQGRQPHRYTTYERDITNMDDASARTYNGWWRHFMQPDPTDFSYDLMNPQSFNRYAYVGNDPVNAVDPSGLCTAADGDCVVDVHGGIGTPGLIGGGGRIEQLPVINIGGDDNAGAIGGAPDPPPHTEKKQPCPPTGAALRNNPAVQGGMEKAFAESGHRTPNPIEQGGWIYQNSRGQLLFRRAGAERLTAGTINLTNPPGVAGATIVGTFHTHTYTEGIANYMLLTGL